MNEIIDAFLTHMKEKGWNIKLNEIQNNSLPEVIRDRYTNISRQWQEFVKKVKCMVSSDEAVWFLGTEDFESQGNKAFQWNEWELISLESAEGDIEWENEIKNFWNEYLPIVMSVKSGYSYYAICIKNGSVVHGAEPEFEECKIVAESFGAFMEKLMEDELQL